MDSASVITGGEGIREQYEIIFPPIAGQLEAISVGEWNPDQLRLCARIPTLVRIAIGRTRGSGVGGETC